MDHDLQKMSRALAGGCLDSVAKAVFAHSALRERTKVLDLVNSECAALCRKTGADGPSPFLSATFEKCIRVFLGYLHTGVKIERYIFVEAISYISATQ